MELPRGLITVLNIARQRPYRRKKSHKGRNHTNTLRNIVSALGLVMPLVLSVGSASAEDTLKVVIGQINNWENQAPTLGQDAGIFKKHGLMLENTGTQGAGETIQAVIAGSADIGAGVGAAGVMRAFSKGAPVRILAPAFTGTGDLYWYVKADSKIQSLKDATPENTIAYSTNGSSSNNIVVAFVSELGAKAKPTATGGPAATLTAVMSGQVDIGWAAPPFGLRELKEDKIRIVARGSDVPSLRGQTVRTLIVNADSLKNKREAIMRFMDAYREAVDWMYSDPKAVEMYSKKMNQPVELLKESMDKFQPKETMQTDKFADLDGAIADAVKLKFLNKPLTQDQVTELLQIPPRKK
jgi:NitT/TauT family transport system substrate-binding protein